MITRELEDEHFKFWIEDGILFGSYKHPIAIDLNLLKQHIRLRHEISQGEYQYFCFLTKGLKNYSKEAREYATVHGQEFIHASAAIIESHVTRFLYNAYTKINRPKVPFKAFYTKQEGIDWLNEIKNKNNGEN